jgi:RNA recognition motif-containing protein
MRPRSRSRSPDRRRDSRDDGLSPAMRELQREQLEAARRAVRAREMGKRSLPASSPEEATSSKKQREIYVGNLAPGVDAVLGTFFDEALARLFPELAEFGPPVLRVNVDPSRAFGFVEFRSEFLAHAASRLDKTDVGGRPIHVGRPRGYVETEPGHAHDRTPVVAAAPYKLANTEMARKRR